MTFIGGGSLAVGGRLFKAAGINTGVVDAVKGVNKRDLRTMAEGIQEISPIKEKRAKIQDF